MAHYLTKDEVREKMTRYKVRATAWLKGTLKNRFFLDCIKRNAPEGDYIRSVLELHYHIVDICPEFKNKTFFEIKEDLTARLLKEKPTTRKGQGYC
jgi:hypothetical protein